METIIGSKNQIITSLLNLEDNKIYKVEIKNFKDKKTLKQNNYMWELISQISKKQYMDEMEVYCQVLEEANVKYIWLKGFPETKEELLMIGTIKEIAKKQGVKKKTILFYQTPAYLKRHEKSHIGNYKVLVKLD